MDLDVSEEDLDGLEDILNKWLGSSEVDQYVFDPVYTLLYGFFAFCMILPPTAFVHAGITIESLFASYLGDEGRSFCEYHMRRTFVTLITCAALPFGNVLMHTFLNGNLMVMLPFVTYNVAPVWSIFSSLSIVILIGGLTVAFWWKLDNWRAHPFASQLRRYADRMHLSENVLIANVDLDFMSIDKFSVGLPGWKVVVTESWIMRTWILGVDIAHQSDARVALLDAHEVDVTVNSSLMRQFLTILIEDRESGASRSGFFKPFTFRLNAVDYNALRTRLSAPIDNVRNILVESSQTEMFVRVFTSQIDSNPTWKVPAGVAYENAIERCIGCASQDGDVKLVRRCHEEVEGAANSNNSCRQCFCRRAMWCARCLALWFATRQDPEAPQTWLSGNAPCPTCRAPFCVVDICRVDATDAVVTPRSTDDDTSQVPGAMED